MQRRCDPCRTAKVQCDLLRPCGRCKRRSHEDSCHYPRASVFRDQNQVAAEASRRARAPRSRPIIVPLDISDPNAPFPKSTEIELSYQFNPTPWLNEAACRLLPPLLYSIEDKAMMRFFAKWTLQPCNHNICPGYFDFLPDLAMHGNVVSIAIQAAAFADVAEANQERGLALRSQQKYGQALEQIREALCTPDTAVADTTVAAILVIDSLELIHAERYEPLGNHADGMILLLRMRGTQQLYTRRGFSLWRLAHHRLQARQLLKNDPPLEESDMWLGMLDQSRPDLHIAAIVHRIISVTSRAKELTFEDFPDPNELEKSLASLEELDQECVQWAKTLDPLWLPTVKRLSDTQLEESVTSMILSQDVHIYHDMWAARTWNYHRACTIKLHETLVLLKQKILHAIPGRLENSSSILEHRTAIGFSCLEILATVPSLLGLVLAEGEVRSNENESKEVGLLFLLLPMWVIQRCELTKAEHKRAAAEVLSFVRRRLRLF